MTDTNPEELESLWSEHQAEWRDPMQITSQWQDAAHTDPKLLHYRVEGDWWDILEECGITLFITREYEHLVMAMQMREGNPYITYTRLPHPSGLTVDRSQGIVYIASTRNPNQVYDYKPVTGCLPRLDIEVQTREDQPLVPVRSRFFPGCLYMHDLAMIQDRLYANAVGHNAIARLQDYGQFERVWYPRCIEQGENVIFGQNHIQLNSIAAGASLQDSFFSASGDTVSSRRPGHKNFPVDKRGVIFSGKTREVFTRGLTRPHSARLYQDQVWVDNSGYGELGVATKGEFTPVTRLPGWTRGLCFYENIAFVGTSRVIPRFRQYAPGLEVKSSLCGVHAVDTQTGKILGSVIWKNGNQIFALEWCDRTWTSGFPFVAGKKRTTAQDKKLFYAFTINP